MVSLEDVDGPTATLVIPCTQISVKTLANNRPKLRLAFSALATQASYLLLQDGVPCLLQLETASEEFLPTNDNRSLSIVLPLRPHQVLHPFLPLLRRDHVFSVDCCVLFFASRLQRP
jgi:hypothetical protein